MGRTWISGSRWSTSASTSVRAECTEEGRGGPAMPALRTPPSPLAGLLRRPLLPALLAFAALWIVFLLVLHPWIMRWGATPEERALPLPGDTAPPSAYFTRAITVDAPPA